MNAVSKLIKISFCIVFMTMGLSTYLYAQRGGGGGRGGMSRGGGMASRGGGFYNPPVYSMGAGIRMVPFGYSHYYRPYLGFSISVLPAGYFSFYYGPQRYYYYDGFFYLPYDSGYQVVAPPVGAELEKLPKKAEEIRINGDLFYVYNGVYYQPEQKQDGKTLYKVVGKDGNLTISSPIPNPNVGDVVEQLPEGCQSVEISGQKLYVSPNGYYYQEDRDDKGTYYHVVGKKD